MVRKLYLNLVLVLILMVIVLSYATSAGAQDSCMTGSYYDPEAAGEGIQLTVLDDVVYGYVYTHSVYSNEWFTFIGDRDPDITPSDLQTMDVYRTFKSGPSPSQYQTWLVGQMDVNYKDGDNILFQLHLELDLNRLNEGVSLPYCLYNCNRTLDYTRLTALPGNECGE
jgi:hypothetical protein